ncbi:MAG: histidine kinase [Candidatus Limnocylindrales bacterium]
MESGASGESGGILLDALHAEAKEALSQGANQLRSIQERLREAHGSDLQVWRHVGIGTDVAGTASPNAASLTRGRDLLTRLELAVRDLEQMWLFLQPGGAVDAGTPGRQDIDGTPMDGNVLRLVARHVLEAREDERTRIAEELHDGPAQAFANAAFQVEVIERTLQRDREQAFVELNALRDVLAAEMDRLRGFIHQLRPMSGDDSDLELALGDVIDRLRSESGLEIEVAFSAPQTLLDEDRRSVVLRVAQEAFRNVQKHAGASHVWLATRLERANGSPLGPTWVFEVRDDGRGFAVDDALALHGRRHFGLRFMRERARLVGARLDIDSTPTVGTTVRLTMDTGEELQAWP